MQSRAAIDYRSSESEISQILTWRAEKYDLSEKLREIVRTIINKIENFCTGPTGCNFNQEMIECWAETPALAEILKEDGLSMKERELIFYVLYGMENVN
jgi:hypothetical protein